MSSTTGTYGAPPAPAGRRVGAWLLDGLLTAVCAAPLLLATVPARLAALRDPDQAAAAPSPVLLAAAAVLLLAWAGVQWTCQGTRGWTVGRRVLGLRTLDVRTGRPIGMGRALVRALVVAAGVLACGVGQLLVLASPLFDGSGRRRGWHDRVAEAIVVDVRGRPAARRVAAWDGPPARRTPAGGAVPVAPDRLGTAVPHPAQPAPVESGPVESDPAAGDPAAGGPAEPHRTRWTALAAERQLDGPGLVLPPFGAPGLGPDLDTRQLPRVASAAPPPAPPLRPVAPALDDRAPAAPGRGRHAVSPEPPVPPVHPGAAVPPVAPTPIPGWPPSTASLPPVPSPAGDLPPLPPAMFPAPDPLPAGDPSWAVRLPDGSVLPLDVPLLVGRNPDPLPGVRPVPVADPTRSVSKTHLMVGVDEHGAWVVDRGSTNGTLVTLADGQRIVCLPDRRVRLTDGSLVAFGDLSLSVGVRA